MAIANITERVAMIAIIFYMGGTKKRKIWFLISTEERFYDSVHNV